MWIQILPYKRSRFQFFSSYFDKSPASNVLIKIGKIAKLSHIFLKFFFNLYLVLSLIFHPLHWNCASSVSQRFNRFSLYRRFTSSTEIAKSLFVDIEIAETFPDPSFFALEGGTLLVIAHSFEVETRSYHQMFIGRIVFA